MPVLTHRAPRETSPNRSQPPRSPAFAACCPGRRLGHRAGRRPRPAGRISCGAHRPAMGSSFEVRLPSGTPGAVDLACRALDLIDDAGNPVDRLPRRLGGEPAQRHGATWGRSRSNRALFGLLQDAVTLSRETERRLRRHVGALSEAWGFVKGPKRVPDPETLAEARARTGWHHLRLDPERRTVAFDREGLRINLGSIGKGYAIDRAVALIRAYWWPTSGLVHGGRSSLYAIGSPPGRFGGRWEILLHNPFQPESPLGVFRCGIGPWARRARRSSSSSSRGGSTAISSTPGRASRRWGRPASRSWRRRPPRPMPSRRPSICSGPTPRPPTSRLTRRSAPSSSSSGPDESAPRLSRLRSGRTRFLSRRPVR